MNKNTGAAPPDAGGHLGAHTQPEDLVQPVHESAPPAPELSTDGRRAPAGGTGVGGFVVMGVVIAVVAAVFLLVYGPG